MLFPVEGFLWKQIQNSILFPNCIQLVSLVLHIQTWKTIHFFYRWAVLGRDGWGSLSWCKLFGSDLYRYHSFRWGWVQCTCGDRFMLEGKGTNGTCFLVFECEAWFFIWFFVTPWVKHVISFIIGTFWINLAGSMTTATVLHGVGACFPHTRVNWPSFFRCFILPMDDGLGGVWCQIKNSNLTCANLWFETCWKLKPTLMISDYPWNPINTCVFLVGNSATSFLYGQSRSDS